MSDNIKTDKMSNLKIDNFYQFFNVFAGNRLVLANITSRRKIYAK